ncbi:TlpA family protein disulfide reductase [Haloplanus aerogenes]|uniref:Thiol-disulfide isomerase/thioredoxin n=1 Tax=Haloplanus aerogenes TaxID=660522 RepID=A0A3M0DAX4_9EURY|nr:TlpA disulfide reductase family protein [Haloplanus aerogenes]AZH26152.1 TlpA family protein disulfide reductase [Haloplanus aerogenes]RMB18395.1 thiol-disulfide isomerase/thioredoxin [Haloplanus aerogenes]
MSDDSDDGGTLGRRHLLAGLVGTGLVGAGAVGSGVVDVGSKSGAHLPVEVTTLDAVGSTAGTQQVPAAGTPTLIDCFATWCGPCIEQMDSLGTAYDRYGDEVAFVSVTNERFGGGLDADDVRAWWRDNDGRWTLGHDPEGDLLAALGASGLPYLALTDAEGSVVWTHGGVASAETLDREISSVV